ncbi:MAG: hypothetical protein ACREKE_10685 [bacterium]
MSPVTKAQPFPNLFFSRTDGTSFELLDLRKQKHVLLLFIQESDPVARSFLSLFQDRAKLFDWLDARLVAVFSQSKSVYCPWPAPSYPPCLLTEPLPEGLEWGNAYVVSKNGSLLEIYLSVSELSVEKVERDLLYWEAGHCLPS